MVSILLGLVALSVAILGLFPFIGIVNWLALPIAALGGAIGAMSSSNAGRNLNIFVLILAALRLSLGGGIL
jgi:TRAP-type mannitol/chloroaromatic compound transport system permease small subunit